MNGRILKVRENCISTMALTIVLWTIVNVILFKDGRRKCFGNVLKG